ncbi:uncharacterized protein [Macrobrachium rosenbergii]|uniref:uncharacterized protein n=1 Tax=Macrobrachium rosenbergii TaxID=79674 RepID=UPI0034D72213
MICPFTNIGIDHTSLLQVEGGVDYVLLATCMSSHAVYLDYCSSLDTATFLLILKKFAATHGTPYDIYSDSHQTFCTTSIFLQDIYDKDNTQQFLRKCRIQLTFQTLRAPWKGGFLECLIRVVKHTLEVSFRCKIFNEEQVQTKIKEAEAVVNNRPLMHAGDSCQNKILTPSHLIRVSMICLMPPVVPVMNQISVHQVLSSITEKWTGKTGRS